MSKTNIDELEDRRAELAYEVAQGNGNGGGGAKAAARELERVEETLREVRLEAERREAARRGAELAEQRAREQAERERQARELAHKKALAQEALSLAVAIEALMEEASPLMERYAEISAKGINDRRLRSDLANYVLWKANCRPEIMPPHFKLRRSVVEKAAQRLTEAELLTEEQVEGLTRRAEENEQDTEVPDVAEDTTEQEGSDE